MVKGGYLTQSQQFENMVDESDFVKNGPGVDYRNILRRIGRAAQKGVGVKLNPDEVVLIADISWAEQVAMALDPHWVENDKKVMKLRAQQAKEGKHASK